MARPLRIQFPGAVYHITSRGNAQSSIFTDDFDRNFFLKLLAELTQRYNWICHAYCLMRNHYHLLIETPDGNLSEGMRQLNGIYTQKFNHRHGRVGHVFQGRFKSMLVDKNSYLLELCRYIVLNPVRAGLVVDPGDYPWSSYNQTIGQYKQELLSVNWILAQFSNNKRIAQHEYVKFVLSGLGQEPTWKKMQRQCIVGNNKFIKKLEPILQRNSDIKEIPRIQRYASRPPLKDFLHKRMSRQERNDAIIKAHREYGYTQQEIAVHIGFHYSTISKIINQDGVRS